MRLTLINYFKRIRLARTGNVCPLEEREFESRGREESIKNWSEREREIERKRT